MANTFRTTDLDLADWDDEEYETEERIGRPSTFGKMRRNDGDDRGRNRDKRARRRDVRGRKEAELNSA